MHLKSFQISVDETSLHAFLTRLYTEISCCKQYIDVVALQYALTSVHWS